MPEAQREAPEYGWHPGPPPRRSWPRLAKKIAAERQVTFAQAHVEALKHPHLYLVYLQEQEAKLGPGARRG